MITPEDNLQIEDEVMHIDGRISTFIGTRAEDGWIITNDVEYGIEFTPPDALTPVKRIKITRTT